MSYILEALRKAEAERRRGAVPDLHAQQVLPAGAAGADAGQTRARWWPWLAGIALLGAAGAAAWLLLGRLDAPVRLAAPAPLAAASEAPAAPAAVVSRGEAAPSAAAAAPSAPAAVAAGEAVAPTKAAKAAPAARKAAARRETAPPSKATARAEPPVAAVAAQAKPKPPSATAVDPAAAVSATPAGRARVPTLAELPGDLRQQVPALAIGGSVYSPQASARMVVINGQVFQEGSALTPELKLEQIRAKSAVFTIRGQRFELPL